MPQLLIDAPPVGSKMESDRAFLKHASSSLLTIQGCKINTIKLLNKSGNIQTPAT